MTFKDFAAECELFEHSNDYWDVCKECSEIELTEQYISNQIHQHEFMMENGLVPAEEQVQLTEGFFTEAASFDQMTALMEEVKEKKENVFKRFWNWIKGLVSKFAKWLLKHSGDDSLVEKAEVDKLLAQLNQKDEAHQAALAEMQKKLDEALNKNGILLTSLKDKSAKVVQKTRELSAAKEQIKKGKDDLEQAKKDQEDTKKYWSGEYSKKSAESEERLKTIISMIHEAKDLRAQLAAAGESKAVGPVALANIMEEMVNAISKLNDHDQAAVKQIIASTNAKLDQAAKDCAAHGVPLPTHGQQYKVLSDRLEKMLKEAETAMQEVDSDEIKKEAKEKGVDASVLNEVKALYAKVVAACGDTMKLMSAFRNCQVMTKAVYKETKAKLDSMTA